MKIYEKIRSLIEAQFPKAIVKEERDNTPPTFCITPSEIVNVCQLLHTNKDTYFDSLSCLTGIDNGTLQNTMEVIYHLYSIPHHYSLALKVILEREKPEIHTLSHIWKTAEWHEREAYDLLGIYFLKHPDLRRILLPTDWKGHPLRKDYREEETYHTIKVKY